VRASLVLMAALAIGCGAAQRPLPPGACSPMPEGDDARPWERRGYRLPVPWFAPRRGAARPRVVLQVFSDFECPYCARATPTLDRVIEEYGACVQVVWRNRPMPYHPHAALAARAATEVYAQRGDAAFWTYHDRLFARQDELSRALLEREAEALGLDMAAFAAALDGDAHQHVIDRDRAAITRIELEAGTPSFFINGSFIHGARSYRVFAHHIEEALREQLGAEAPR